MLKFKFETEFKETEIGEIPKGWNVKRLDDISKDAIVGSTPLKRNFKYWENGNIPWLTNKEVEYEQINYLWDTEEKISDIALKKTNLKLAPPMSLIISFTASVGKVAINKVPLTTNQQFISFILKDNFNVVYYAYYFVLSKDIVESYSGATPFSFITKKSALAIPVPFPNPVEQSRIAKVLSWFDDIIENKKKQNEILEKTAMAIFKGWFIDFEPFKHEEFVDSELGRIPKGWEVDYITRIIEFNPKVRLTKGQIYPFVEMKLVSTNSMVSEYDYNEFDGSGVRFQGKDTLLARITPSLENGKTTFVWFIEKNQAGFGTTEFIVMRAKQANLDEFIYLLARTEDFREHAINSMSGSTGRQRVEKEALEALKISLPPPTILRKFHSIADPLFQKVILNQKQITAFRKIRDTLLPLLVFGKLRVEEI